MFRQIFSIPIAGLLAIVFSIYATPSDSGPLMTTGVIGELEQAAGTNTILVEEGNRTRSRNARKRRVQRAREGNRQARQDRSRAERKAKRSQRRARKSERRVRKAERRTRKAERRARRAERRRVRDGDRRARRANRSRAERRAERRARKAERRRDRRRHETRRHDRRKHANKRHRHKHKRHRRHRHFGFYGYGGLFPYSPFGGYDYYRSYDYGRYDYGDPYYEPRRRTRISCKRARKHLRRSGYRRMRAYDCRGKVYGFYAWRGKYRYKVRISAYTSRILVARRI